MVRKSDIQMVVMAVLPTLLFIQICRVMADSFFYTEKPTVSLFSSSLSVPPAAGPEKVAVAVAPLAERLAKADPAKGMNLAKKCAACHTFTEGGKTVTGPNLYDIVNRPVAAHQGFAYSEAIKSKGGKWTLADLDKYLTNPKDAVPGNKMAFAGLPDPAERADLLAYLRSLSATPAPLPSE